MYHLVKTSHPCSALLVTSSLEPNTCDANLQRFQHKDLRTLNMGEFRVAWLTNKNQIRLHLSQALRPDKIDLTSDKTCSHRFSHHWALLCVDIKPSALYNLKSVQA